MTAPPTGDGYRTERLERDVAQMAQRFEQGVARAEAKVEAIMQQQAHMRESLPELYVPRREINERFANLNEDTVRLRRDLEVRIDQHGRDAAERRAALNESLDRRLTHVEGTLTWLTRLVMGALITGLLGLLMALALAGLTARSMGVIAP